MATESIQNICPLCQSRVIFRFPTDYPKMADIEALYCHAVMHASGNRARASTRVLGIGYRTMMSRLNRPIPSITRKPLSREQIAAAMDTIEHSNHLQPVDVAGVCSGTFSLIARNDDASIYDIRFNEAVKGISNREDVDAGGRPRITMVEEDGSQRVFEFGEPFQDDMTVFIIPVRAQNCMAIVIKTEFEE